MEKTMTMNVKLVGTDKAKARKRDHVAIWREILKDVRRQCEEAEHGRY